MEATGLFILFHLFRFVVSWFQFCMFSRSHFFPHDEKHLLEVSISGPENGLTALEEMSVCHPWCFRDSYHCRHQTCHGQFWWTVPGIRRNGNEPLRSMGVWHNESQETCHCDNLIYSLYILITICSYMPFQICLLLIYHQGGNRR